MGETGQASESRRTTWRHRVRTLAYGAEDKIGRGGPC